jgi:glycosyltransferase involved in cell wall biosynthesis
MAEVIGDAGEVVEPEGLAAALTRLRDDAEHAANLRTAALERAELFDWDHIARDVRDGWRELVTGSRQSLSRPMPARASVS